jgi:hypothetical protein
VVARARCSALSGGWRWECEESPQKLATKRTLYATSSHSAAAMALGAASWWVLWGVQRAARAVRAQWVCLARRLKRMRRAARQMRSSRAVTWGRSQERSASREAAETASVTAAEERRKAGWPLWVLSRLARASQSKAKKASTTQRTASRT